MSATRTMFPMPRQGHMWGATSGSEIHYNVLARLEPLIQGALCRVIIGIYLLTISILRPLFTYFRIPVPIHLIGQLADVVGVCLIASGAIAVLKSRHPANRLKRSTSRKLALWFCLIVALTLYGLWRGNDWRYIGVDCLGLTCMGLFLVLSAEEQFLERFEYHLTIIFYFGAILTFMYINTPAVDVGVDFGLQSFGEISMRHSNTLAMQLRSLLDAGLFLGARGMTRHGGGVSKWLQVFALVVLFVLQVGYYEFRSEAISIVIVCAMVLFVTPLLRRRLSGISAVTLLTLFFIGVLYYQTTDAWMRLSQRHSEESQKGTLLSTRNDEVSALRQELGWRIVVGNGLGGAFDASSVYRHVRGAKTWQSTHYGVLACILKGGVLLLLVFVSFFVPCIVSRRSTSWYRDPYNITAAVLLPVYLFRACMIPMPFNPDFFCENFGMMFVIARYGMIYKVPRMNFTPGRQKACCYSSNVACTEPTIRQWAWRDKHQ